MISCTDCGEIKQETDFPIRYRIEGKEYRGRQCKICYRKRQLKNYYAKHEIHCERHKLYRLSHKTRYILTENQQERKNKLARIKRLNSRGETEKNTARQSVNRAIKRGILIRPDRCEICGISDKKLVAHHPDYNQHLTVLWICSPCHSAVHYDKKESKQCLILH